jgi:drug/metabolite transporter (DMT)-like permease
MGKSLGILLIVVGLIMVVWSGFTYTKKEKIIDAGPIQVTADKQETVNWPPYVGAIAMVAGVVIYIAARRRQ